MIDLLIGAYWILPNYLLEVPFCMLDMYCVQQAMALDNLGGKYDHMAWTLLCFQYL